MTEKLRKHLIKRHAACLCKQSIWAHELKRKKKASRLTKYVPRMLNDSCNQMHIFIIFMDLRCHDPDGLTEKRT